MFLFVLVAASLLGDWLGFALDADRIVRIRYAGWLLDIIGIVVIAAGLSRKLNLFRGISISTLLWTGITDFLRAFPLLRRHVTLNISSAVHLHSSMNANLTTNRTFDSAWSIDEKISYLVEECKSLANRADDLEKKIAEQTKNIRDDLQTNIAEIIGELSKVERRRADLHIGEVGGEVVGLAWILCGISFATVPELIAIVGAYPIDMFERLGDLVGLGALSNLGE